MVPPVQAAVHQDFECAGMAVHAAIFKQSRKHAGHTPRHGIECGIGRVIQREAKVPFHAIHGFQNTWQLVRVHHVAQHSPGLGVQINLAAAGLPGTDVFRFRKRPHIPFPVPGGQVNGALHFVISFLKKSGVGGTAQPIHQRNEFLQRQAELF